MKKPIHRFILEVSQPNKEQKQFLDQLFKILQKKLNRLKGGDST